jgi:TIR domain
LKTTIFLAHAAPDHEFADDLAEFLESGCDVTCYSEDGLMAAGGDLLAKAEEGLTADILILLLSIASWPMRRPRQDWEPVLVDQAREATADVATVLLEDCPFPEVWRRRNFFDASANRRVAMRLVKRWLWQRRREPGIAPSTAFSRDLEPLYREIADRAGVEWATGERAARFASEAAEEFETVFWIPGHGRSLAQLSGELGAQAGVTLDGVAEENCMRIRNLLAERRCLLVLDAAQAEFADALTPGGRTSTLITEDPVQIVQTPESFEYARGLAALRRYAEAYELLHRLLDAETAPEACARELTWICEHWGRIEEANTLRFYYGPEPATQLLLF